MVLPAEVQAEVLARTGMEGLRTAFPLGTERADSLRRAGVSADQLAEHGIDLERDGFTLGLGPAAKGNRAPPLRLGRLDRSTYGADLGESLTGLAGHVGATPVAQAAVHGGTGTTFGNGTYREDYDDGSGGQITKDDDLVTWNATGGHGDSEGEGDHGRTDPDAEGTTAPTEEQLAAWTRFHGAAVRTAEGRPKPERGDLEEAQGRRNPLILTDDTVPGAYALVLDAPRITTAQPEVAQGFRDSTVPAGGFGSGCGGRC